MNTKYRESNTELIRILACLSVIALHTWIGSGIDEVSVLLKGVIRIFEKHGVPLFMMITGYYLFRQSESYAQKYRKMLMHVVLPFLCAFVFYEIFADYLEGVRRFSECIIEPTTNPIMIVGQLIRGDYGYNPTFWYIYEYIKIYVYMPLLGLLCGAEKKTIRRGYMLLCIVMSLLKNLAGIFGQITMGQAISVINWSPIDVHMLYILTGYEIANISEDFRLRIKEKRFVFLGLYVFFNLLIAAEEFWIIKSNLGIETNYLYENSIFHIFSAIMIFIFLKSFNDVSGKPGKVICLIGGYTYYIYLIHYMFVKLVANYNLMSFVKSGGGILKYIITIMLIFVVSLVLSVIVKRTQQGILSLKKGE